MSFTDLIDLAAARLGGRALLANDEFFAPKENLLAPGPAIFKEGEYTDRGKWMDGWETRRRREPGHDWCIVALGLPGEIHGVNVDTRHFRGNHPEACSVDGIAAADGMDVDELASSSAWFELLPRTELAGDSDNLIEIPSRDHATHVRLNIYPDGGVARFRCHGVVAPRATSGGETIDLIAVENGGRPLSCSDRFFSEPSNLIMPGRGADMGDGWETRRRRGPGHDWVIIALGKPGTVRRIEVDTLHFKGNYPASCSLEGCAADGRDVPADDSWRELAPKTTLEGDTRNVIDIVASEPVTHVRFNIYPDGGVSRLRLHGEPR